jgi:transglutaminase-like putative cysteine protease
MRGMLESIDPRDEGPWTIPLTTPAAERQRILDRIADAGLARPEVRALAADLARAADRAAAGDPRRAMRARAELALALVQALPWRDEWPTEERYQGVTRTLREGGNCNRRSPLLVALLRALGFPSAKCTWVNAKDRTSRNHVVVQVVIDGADCEGGLCRAGWCWSETTVHGARLCADPYAEQRRLEGAAGGDGARAGLAGGLRALPRADGSPVVTETTAPARPSAALFGPWGWR